MVEEPQEAQPRPAVPLSSGRLAGCLGLRSASSSLPGLSEPRVPPRHPHLLLSLHGRGPMRFKNRYLLFELVWKDGKFEESISESVGRL